MTTYVSKLTVCGEAGAEPFLFGESFTAANDTAAWQMTRAWYEGNRPSHYEPIGLVLMQGERQVREYRFERHNGD